MKVQSTSDSVLLPVSNRLVKCSRKVLHTSILESTGCGTEQFESLETMVASSNRKMEYLFDRIFELKSTDRCIVFVEKRMTAKSLYKMIKVRIIPYPMLS